MDAVTSGERTSGLLEALRAQDKRRRQLEADLAAIASQRPLSVADAGLLREELTALANSWRTVLADDPVNARPIVSALLKGRVTVTPTAVLKEWTLTGEGTLAGLFSRVFCHSVVRPQRDSNPSRYPLLPDV
jgi:hypothetical protein